MYSYSELSRVVNHCPYKLYIHPAQGEVFILFPLPRICHRHMENFIFRAQLILGRRRTTRNSSRSTFYRFYGFITKLGTKKKKKNIVTLREKNVVSTPKARDVFSPRSIRPSSETVPPAASIRFNSVSSPGLWSFVISRAVPWSTEITHLESPALAT